jgi:hypothetical protein
MISSVLIEPPYVQAFRIFWTRVNLWLNGWKVQ